MKKFSSSVTLVTFLVVNSYTWLVATILHRADMEDVHHCRKVFWTMLPRLSLRHLPTWIFSESVWELKRKLLCVRDEVRCHFCPSQDSSMSNFCNEAPIHCIKSLRLFLPNPSVSPSPFTGVRSALQPCRLLLLSLYLWQASSSINPLHF